MKEVSIWTSIISFGSAFLLAAIAIAICAKTKNKPVQKSKVQISEDLEMELHLDYVLEDWNKK